MCHKCSLTDSGDVKRDIGHILDFITRLKCLQVTIVHSYNNIIEYFYIVPSTLHMKKAAVSVDMHALILH